jgi:hypothetical protein
VFETVWKHDGWNIGVIDAPAAALLAPDVLPPVSWLNIAARNTFFADPFLIEERGTMYCFFEELPYGTNRGVISYVELDGARDRPLEIHPAISEPHHLSYPFLLRYGGDILCIPEGSASGQIVAYAARAFPNGWYRKATLLDFPGVDPTIFRHGDYWWLFCTDLRNGSNAALQIFYADDLFGTWRAHAGNPVVTDPARGRPGGRPFVSDGALYRVAQNCSSHYGGSLAIIEVLELTPERYVERTAAELKPAAIGPYPDGLHTACAEGHTIAIDGNRYRFEAAQARRVIAVKARSLISQWLVRPRGLG